MVSIKRDTHTTQWHMRGKIPRSQGLGTRLMTLTELRPRYLASTDGVSRLGLVCLFAWQPRWRPAAVHCQLWSECWAGKRLSKPRKYPIRTYYVSMASFRAVMLNSNFVLRPFQVMFLYNSSCFVRHWDRVVGRGATYNDGGHTTGRTRCSK